MPSQKIKDIASTLAEVFPKSYCTEAELLEGWRLYQTYREVVLGDEALMQIDEVCDLAVELFKRRYKTA